MRQGCEGSGAVALFGYTYDANGNRLTETINGATTTSTYDAADRLTSNGSVTYGYDASGNLVSRGTDTFAWDYAGRMTQAVVGGVQADYTYDGDGVRVSKTVGVDETDYHYDRVGGLPLVVDDGTTSYVHVGGPLAQIDNASGDRLDLLLDGLGSVRGISYATGAITGTVDYGAFGGIRGATGAASVFGFTGEQYGPETGLVHLRARQYDPASGRFLSADPVRPASRATIWIPV